MFIYRKEVTVPVTGTSNFNIELTNFPDVHPPNLMIAVESFHYKCWSQFATLLRPNPYKLSDTDYITKFGDLYVKANNDTMFKHLLTETQGFESFTYDSNYPINELGVPIAIPPNKMINFQMGFKTTDYRTLVVTDHTLPDLGITYQYFLDAGYIAGGPDYRQPINGQNCFITFTVIIYSFS